MDDELLVMIYENAKHVMEFFKCIDFLVFPLLGISYKSPYELMTSRDIHCSQGRYQPTLANSMGSKDW